MSLTISKFILLIQVYGQIPELVDSVAQHCHQDPPHFPPPGPPQVISIKLLSLVLPTSAGWWEDGCSRSRHHSKAQILPEENERSFLPHGSLS